MKFYQTLLIYLLLAGITACSSETKYGKQISYLNGLMTTLDSIEQVLNDIDTAKVYYLAATVKPDLEYIQGAYRGIVNGEVVDTIDIETAIVLERYYQIKKGINGFNDNYRTIQDNIIYSRDQIWRLTENLKINKWDEETSQEYVDDETVVVNSIRMELTSVIEGVEFACIRFDTIKPLIDSIITEINARPVNQ